LPRRAGAIRQPRQTRRIAEGRGGVRQAHRSAPFNAARRVEKSRRTLSVELGELMMRIFVADDSAILRRRIIGQLTGLRGVEVVGQAQDVSEALRAIRELKPDVVTLDVQMIGGSGIELLKIIRRDDHRPVVLMLTNHAHPRYREKCLELGADYFLDKARDSDKLTEILRRLAEQFAPSVAEAT